MEAVIAPSLALHPSLVVRMVSFLALPFSLSVPLLAALGMHNRLIANNPSTAGANLFACNHRSMLDPLYVSAAGRADLAAATYNISRILEILSPIPTFRLTRGRAAMQAKLSGGSGLVVCPEGTTCREPFLLLLPWTGSRWISLRVIVLPWIGSRRRWGVDDVVGPMRQ